jgi:hypothetical protein
MKLRRKFVDMRHAGSSVISPPNEKIRRKRMTKIKTSFKIEEWLERPEATLTKAHLIIIVGDRLTI